MTAPSVLVSSPLRKLINKNTSSSGAVSSLCFINVFFQIIDLFLIHLYGCYIWLVDFAGVFILAHPNI